LNGAIFPHRRDTTVRQPCPVAWTGV